jgi:hypothetical protein
MTLPADGYIVFNPLVYDGYVRGVFYVTNNSGFTYQLSGFDSSFNYYSWIELDAEVPVYPTDVDFNNIGFGNNFDLTYNSNFDQKTGDDTVSGTASALLFIHDDPYSYDDADHTYEYWEDNSIGIEIRGIIKTIETYKGGTVTQWTGKLSGSGSINVEDGNYGEVTSGSATFAK